MEFRTLIERVGHILLQPDDTWETIRLEQISISEILKEYVLKLAAVPAAAHFLGWWVLVGFWSSLTRALLWYFLSVAGVWIISKVIGLLAAQFGAEENETSTFKLAAFSFTPYFLAGICYIVPPMMIFVVVGGIYGFYLLYRGIPIVLEIPKEKAAPYAGMISIAMFLVFCIIGRLTGGVLWPSKP